MIVEALWRLRVSGVLTWALPYYWVVLFPRARRELRAWERDAHRIADPALRAHALRKLAAEGLTAEGAAAFAILAPLRSARHVVRACVAYEVIFDYLDALGEQPVAGVLDVNRALYGALAEALCPNVPIADWRPRCPSDGGYLLALVAACRDALRRLPAQAHVEEGLLRLALRTGEAQSLHHAAEDRAGERALARWALVQQPAGPALHWWELAAAAGSPMGVYALIAAAARRRTTGDTARAVERAYFPWIAALSWLLESLVDHEDDALAGDAHSYVAHYDAPRGAARRLATIAVSAKADARRLPHGARHTLLLAGMTGMYLSHAGAASVGAQAASAAIREALGWPVTPLLRVLRLRRRLARPQPRRGRAAPAGGTRREPRLSGPRRRSVSRAARRRWPARRSPRRAARRR